MGRVREILEARSADQLPDERDESVWAELNRLRKDFALDLARVEMEQSDALGPVLAARLCPTLLDKLQRHPERGRFVEALREAAGGDDDDLARLARDLLAGRADAGVQEAERDLAQHLREADAVAEDLGLACRLVPREVAAPPARLLARASADCADRDRNPSSSCEACRLWRPYPSGARALVPRVVGDWVKGLGKESERCHRELSGVLSPWMLVPGG